MSTASVNKVMAKTPAFFKVEDWSLLARLFSENYDVLSSFVLEFLLILPVLRPTHGSLTIGPLINIPKGFSSKTTLEVAPRALESWILDS